MEWFAHHWGIIDQLSPFLLQGLWVTFQVSIIAIFLGSTLGAILGILKTLQIYALEKLING